MCVCVSVSVCMCVCVCVKMGADGLHLKYTASKPEVDWCVQLHPTDSKSGKPQGCGFGVWGALLNRSISADS